MERVPAVVLDQRPDIVSFLRAQEAQVLFYPSVYLLLGSREPDQLLELFSFLTAQEPPILFYPSVYRFFAVARFPFPPPSQGAVLTNSLVRRNHLGSRRTQCICRCSSSGLGSRQRLPALLAGSLRPQHPFVLEFRDSPLILSLFYSFHLCQASSFGLGLTASVFLGFSHSLLFSQASSFRPSARIGEKGDSCRDVSLSLIRRMKFWLWKVVSVCLAQKI